MNLTYATILKQDVCLVAISVSINNIEIIGNSVSNHPLEGFRKSYFQGHKILTVLKRCMVLDRILGILYVCMVRHREVIIRITFNGEEIK